MGKNCTRTGIDVGANNLDYRYIKLPAGTTSLTVTSSGGTGNCDLYFKKDAWATTTSWTKSATGPGNNHTITATGTSIRNGDNYITLYGATPSGCTGVSLTTTYTP
ncbi:PPC domain-containing protein [Streptomyces sp. NPDC020800]|uniref:PPC domain-containing protein n=1 Tax=Streptomyces sp. NPDC020800 TaxID=3365092 RepID=UPI00379DD8AF